MSFYPTRPQVQFLCFTIISILLVLSCSKDSDLLKNSILNDDIQSIEDRDSQNETEIIDEEIEVSPEIELEAEVLLESRTTKFFPIQDAYLNDGDGVNHDVIRLQTDKRTSYLLYDLSAIDSIGGEIINTEFQFTIFKDGGDGEIKIHKGAVLKWHEDEINATTAPETQLELGSIDKTYEIGQTETVELDASLMSAENTTIILEQLEGNDLAIASKENPTAQAPILVITYETAVDAGAIEDYMSAESIVSEEDDKDEVVVNELNIEVTADKIKGDAPLKVVFTSNESSADDVLIKTYNWDFKDGTTTDSQNPTHTFNEVGIYKVELSVTDEENRTNSTTLTIVVGEHKNVAPVAKATADKTSGEAPLKVKFNGKSSTDDLEIKSYLWDFKDGKSTSISPTHTFEKAGTYIVEFTVTDEEGLSDQESITIEVKESKNDAPIAKATADKTSGEAPLKVRFSGKDSSDDTEIKSYSWDFKDGKSSSINPTHTFDKAGKYIVEFTVTDEDGLSDQVLITIEVDEPANEKPSADAAANKTKGEVPLVVEFSSKKSTDDKKITNYTWDFDGNGTATDENPTLTFNQPGTFKVKLTVEDAEGLVDSDYITITVEEEEVAIPSTSADVRYWKERFDSQWSQDRSEAYSMSNSRGRNQEYYYLGLYIDGLSSMWQATGDNEYLDTALELIYNTVDDAKSVGGGYLGWPASDGNEYDLWDAYYWRHVSTLLRIIHQSSSIKNSSKYKNQYKELLAFSEKNIWDRYYNANLKKIYRSRTHMASHWARIGMELYIITGKSKYKEVFENISYGNMVDEPSNLRNQLYDNPKDASAYAWDQTWGVRKGSNIQDTSHAGPIVSFITLAYENGMYWKKSDANALLRTIDVVWTGPDNIKLNVDGSGGDGAKGRLHEWFYLARYSQSLQNRIKKDYQSNPHLNFFGSQVLGIAALNSKILSDGSAVYPR
ncbi:PKD domain-containing protein [Aurantibacter crassamenti]|uniref:PKD domain-containing protein n=1 Tax=Aurantibacter crassamenti TaxID=1837375 RepID=UPI001939C199|nr:PKD domain-containing protein [Aurantibacter crassamenti]MBM1106773.1 PKD domain-containing protein [Aurantibacter crassamenti]